MKKILIVIGMFIFILTGCANTDHVQESESNSGKQNEEKNQNEANDNKSNDSGVTSEGEQDDPERSTPDLTEMDMIEFGHVHGMGFNSEGNRLLLSSHTGLKVYEDGIWREGEGEGHDYMGFAMAKDSFFSSGHPALGSELKNPLGIVKSSDEGKNLEQLTLYGEVDFHVTGVSYNTHTLYVMNFAQNSIMEDQGLYYTQNETQTWIKSLLEGFPSQLVPGAVTVHPDEDSIIAITTEDGLYLSKNYGDSFEKWFDGYQITAAYFDFDDQLWVGTYNGQAGLQYMDLNTGKITAVNIPDMPKDAIQYITLNPENTLEMIIATYNVDMYKSVDGSQSWDTIAQQGKPISNLD
ncbi:F510_1955 family glycosylhydrolase [Chengkuizengella sediminis]|uniref:F510_1955 family glycosylhydrolase n=1 Tax=Chengkuizengella sediminis TaxID=1885917 RepID=UPI00138A5F88|nr:glycosyl hydrolase [Chengkuizengella sediminis]NDI34070.1 glycosyl hydrolase [Chengkuizengella sediminis]